MVKYPAVVAEVDHHLRGAHAGAHLGEGDCAFAVRYQPWLVCVFVRAE